MRSGTPQTRYVAVGDSDVAYQVVGDGPLDLLYFYGLGSHLDLLWDNPLAAKFHERLASFSRLILFDRRGTGASDRVSREAIPTWEESTEDVRAVLDAAGSERAAVFAVLDAGPIALLFAAMHPERVSALILANTSCRYIAADDYPIGVPPDEVDTLIETLRALWGTEDLARATAHGRSSTDVEYVRWIARYTRAAATPRTAAALYRYLLTCLDVRAALPLIQVPTLVLHNTKNAFVPVEHGRYLADHIAGSLFVELPGEAAGIDATDEVVAEEVAEFLTGERAVIDIDRVLATVVFTDIVGSTQHLVSVGDRSWRTLLDAHDRMVREQFRRFRGQEVKATGDGFVAAFDGPARAIRCARAILTAAKELGIEVRGGLHTGECEARGNDLAGLAVHIAARVGALAGPGEVLVTSTVRDLVVGSGITFVDHGLHSLKGVPDQWRLLSVNST